VALGGTFFETDAEIIVVTLFSVKTNACK